MMRARRCPASSGASRWAAKGLPHAVHVATADVTGRAGALAMLGQRREELSRVRNVMLDEGYPYCYVRRNNRICQRRREPYLHGEDRRLHSLLGK